MKAGNLSATISGTSIFMMETNPSQNLLLYFPLYVPTHVGQLKGRLEMLKGCLESLTNSVPYVVFPSLAAGLSTPFCFRFRFT
jgi:hypothetical protein